MPANQAPSMMNYVMLIALPAIVYFMMIRPQQKRDKAQKQMRAGLKVGDKVMSIGGILGTVVKVKEDSVVIETGDNKNRITFDKVGIAKVLSDETGTK
ncbi:MAG: preprotein translocase subunit YajC [Peptostreptococcaceae bacterium]|nr:preprotein translocase subunit YajC [Peptostreptococcaceae bacterium]